MFWTVNPLSRVQILLVFFIRKTKLLGSNSQEPTYFILAVSSLIPNAYEWVEFNSGESNEGWQEALNGA
jgi:hypothetical protein